MSTKVGFLPVVCVLAAAVVTVGCGSPGEAGATGGPAGSEGDTLTVFAAASLTDAFGELGEEFTDKTGAEVTFNFGSSSTLAAQIGQGASAEVFASADEAQMQNIADGGLVSGEPDIFARNREVVVVPADNPGDIEKFADLANPDLTLVLAQEEVPAAEYAEEILANAAEDPEYGESFEKDVMGNIVSREEDVRASVNRVVVGDADGTFGYASDVTPSIRQDVGIVEIPENLQVIAEYPIATLSGARDQALAQQWVDFVTGEEGQDVLGKWGFETID